jgi:cytochrome c556
MGHRLALPAAVAGSLLVVACATPASQRPVQERQFTEAVSAPARLTPVQPLPPPMGELLRERMGFHAREMGRLMEAVMILDYPTVEAGAEAIGADVRLARATTQDATELNAALPERFFLLQEELRVHARSLAEAARREDAFSVADAYGRLSQTCVRCHGVYRAGK